MVPEILSETDIFFFVILGYFLPFYPTPPSSLTAQNTEILKKSRKLLEIFYLSTMNKNQKSNDVWFLRYGAQQTEFFSHFGPSFTLDISSFYTGVPQIMIMCYTIPEIWHVTHVTVIFHFGLFFALLPL